MTSAIFAERGFYSLLHFCKWDEYYSSISSNDFANDTQSTPSTMGEVKNKSSKCKGQCRCAQSPNPFWSPADSLMCPTEKGRRDHPNDNNSLLQLEGHLGLCNTDSLFSSKFSCMAGRSGQKAEIGKPWRRSALYEGSWGLIKTPLAIPCRPKSKTCSTSNRTGQLGHVLSSLWLINVQFDSMVCFHWA